MRCIGGARPIARRQLRTLHSPEKAQQEGRGAQSVRGGGTRLARRVTARGPGACVWAIVALVYLLGHHLGPKAQGKSTASGC